MTYLRRGERLIGERRLLLLRISRQRLRFGGPPLLIGDRLIICGFGLLTGETYKRIMSIKLLSIK